jgi:hypothetical protein
MHALASERKKTMQLADQMHSHPLWRGERADHKTKKREAGCGREESNMNFVSEKGRRL